MSTRAKPHRGLSGFGYCVECGQKPGNTLFDPARCVPRGVWVR